MIVKTVLPLAGNLFYFLNAGFSFKQKHDILVAKETIKCKTLFVMLKEEWKW